MWVRVAPWYEHNEARENMSDREIKGEHIKNVVEELNDLPVKFALELHKDRKVAFNDDISRFFSDIVEGKTEF